MPRQALVDAAAWYLQLDSFTNAQVLEQKLEEKLSGQADGENLAGFLESVAAPTPAPGGGSAAAVSGALGVSLFSMVAGLALAKKGNERSEELGRAKAALEPLRSRLLALVAEDAAAFAQVMAAWKLPKATDDEKAKRSAAIEETSKAACEPPLSVMALALEALNHGALLAAKGPASAVSDLGVGALELGAALKGAYWNVAANLGALRDGAFVERTRAEAKARLARGESLAGEVERAADAALGQ